MSALTLDLVQPRPRTALELHSEAVEVCKDIKAHYLKLFDVLFEIETTKAYHDFEITSLYVYCVDLLSLSPQVAKDFINVVRKSLEIPELAESIRADKVTISKARKICSVITAANHNDWIKLATHCSCRVVEKAVAMANPREAVAESMTYVAGNVLEVKFGVSEEWTELLKRTKDLLAQKTRRHVSTEETLFILMSQYCQKNDPVEKAKRAVERADKSENAVVGSGVKETASQSLSVETQTRYRPRLVEHAADLRDQNQCIYVDRNGKRCESKRWLDKHHIVEFSEGGKHTVGNLETLCRAHHKIRHLQNH